MDADMSRRAGTLLTGMIAAAMFVATVSGCIGIGGNTKQQQPTLGQELTDLKVALDRGAITQGEYDSKKAELLGHRD
jgi:hypothetical protein